MADLKVHGHHFEIQRAESSRSDGRTESEIRGSITPDVINEVSTSGRSLKITAANTTSTTYQDVNVGYREYRQALNVDTSTRQV